MREKTDFYGTIEGISILRIVCAFGVAMYHAGTLNRYIQTLHGGVSVFFSLTAFLAMYTTQNGVHNNFVQKRLIRIVPVYWIMTILTFAAMLIMPSHFGEGTWRELIESLFFIPYARISQKSGVVVRPIVGPAWSLYYDVYFTIIFYLCARISFRYRGIIAAGVMIFMGFSKVIFGNSENPLYVIASSPWWLCFAGGIIAYYGSKLLWKKINNKGICLSLCCMAMALLITIFVMPLNIKRNAVISSVLLFAFVLGVQKNKMPHVINILGACSFSFYMIHYYVIILAGKIFDWNAISIWTVIGLICVIVISSGLAYVSYSVVECKVTNKIKMYFEK